DDVDPDRHGSRDSQLPKRLAGGPDEAFVLFVGEAAPRVDDVIPPVADLDDHDRPAVAGDDVDLSAPGAEVAGQDLEAELPEKSRGLVFGLAPAFAGGGVHPRKDAGIEEMSPSAGEAVDGKGVART